MKLRIAKFVRQVRLAARHAGLLMHSFVLLAAVRIALYTTTYHRIAKYVRVDNLGPEGRRPVYLIVWAIEHASRMVPRANCLTRALVLQYLLGRNGHGSIIRVGVAQSDVAVFEAHAWVLYEGGVIMGGTAEEISRYTPIVDLAADIR